MDSKVENNHLALADEVSYRARWFGSHVGLNVTIVFTHQLHTTVLSEITNHRHKKELEVIRGRSKQHIFQVIRGQLKVSGFPLRLCCSPLTGRIIHLAAVCPACDRKTRAKSPSVTGIMMRYHYMNNSFIITLSDRHINLHGGQSDSLMVSVVVLQIKVIASYRVMIAL